MTEDEPTRGSRVGGYGVVWETVGTPTFEFRMAYRRIEFPTTQDHGPTVEVYGRQGDELHEVLKFDCFATGPHWHRCRPGEKDEVSPIEGGSMDAALDFAVATIRDRFEDLATDQGYGRFATPECRKELLAALPVVEGRMREMLRDGGPVQVVRPTS
jgi:hypothetical protein